MCAKRYRDIWSAETLPMALPGRAVMIACTTFWWPSSAKAMACSLRATPAYGSYCLAASQKRVPPPADAHLAAVFMLRDGAVLNMVLRSLSGSLCKACSLTTSMLTTRVPSTGHWRPTGYAAKQLLARNQPLNSCTSPQIPILNRSKPHKTHISFGSSVSC